MRSKTYINQHISKFPSEMRRSLETYGEVFASPKMPRKKRSSLEPVYPKRMMLNKNSSIFNSSKMSNQSYNTIYRADDVDLKSHFPDKYVDVKPVEIKIDHFVHQEAPSFVKQRANLIIKKNYLQSCDGSHPSYKSGYNGRYHNYLKSGKMTN